MIVYIWLPFSVYMHSISNRVLLFNIIMYFVNKVASIYRSTTIDIPADTISKLNIPKWLKDNLGFAKQKKRRRKKNPNNIFGKFTVDNTNQLFRMLSIAKDADKMVNAALSRGIDMSFWLYTVTTI